MLLVVCGGDVVDWVVVILIFFDKDFCFIMFFDGKILIILGYVFCEWLIINCNGL